MNETFTLTQLPQNDFALVLDRSRSMGQYGHFPPVKRAAEDFVGLLFENDHIAVTSFNEKGRTEFELEAIQGMLNDTASVRYKAQKAIQGISAKGFSSIGSGIDFGQQELDKNLDSLPQEKHQNMVLMSDGYENFPPLFQDYMSKIPETTNIYTIGLSELVDCKLLSYIAGNTGGSYVFSPTTKELREIYSFLQTKSRQQDVIDIRDVRLDAGTSDIIKMPVDSSIQTLNFTLHHSNGDYEFTLSDPYHTFYNDSLAEAAGGMLYFRDKAYTAYYINDPEPGTWELKIHNNAHSGNSDAIVLGSAYSDINMEVGAGDTSYRPGEDITITTKISPVGNQKAKYSVVADVLYPLQDLQYDMKDTSLIKSGLLNITPDGKSYLDNNGDTIYTTSTIKLRDDGQEDDALADDGIYTGTFSSTNITGSYTFRIQPTKNGSESEFKRFDMFSAVVSDEEYDDNLTQVTVPGDFFSIQEAIDSVHAWGGWYRICQGRPLL